jgi:HD associated region
MGLSNGAIARTDLYGLDDEEFFSAFSSSRFPSFELIERVRRRELYRQVWRAPFDDRNAVHRRLEDVRDRLQAEDRIAREAGEAAGRRIAAESIVVDVPERVSYDFDVPIVEPGSGQVIARGGAEARSLFAGIGGDDLPGSIRCISVCAKRDDALLAALAKLDFARILAP